MKRRIVRFALYDPAEKKFMYCYVAPDNKIIYATNEEEIYLFTKSSDAVKAKAEIELSQHIELKIAVLISSEKYEVDYE